MSIAITASSRSDSGTRSSRRLRHQGRVPAVVYGAKQTPLSVTLDHKDLYLGLKKEAFHSSILDLMLDGNTIKVLLRDYQLHPFKRQVLHVDFLRVDPKQVIHVKVPLHFINQDLAPGVKLGGGVVHHISTDIEVSCLPEHLPEYISVDLKDLKAGHTLHADQLLLPTGVSLLPGAEQLGIVVIHTPAGEAAASE